MRGGGATRPGPGTDRQGLRDPQGRIYRRRRTHPRAAGACQNHGGTLQISARDRVRGRPAPHRDRQTATRRIAAHRGGNGCQACNAGRVKLSEARSVDLPDQAPVTVDTQSMDDLLSAARFTDSDAPAIGVFANEVTAGIEDEKDKVLRLYHAIRDDIVYDPYVNFSDPSNFRASDVLANGRGFCIGKAALLAAATRAIGVPARVGYADVRNHLTSRRLYERIKTDIFIWHSYADLHVCGRWVKATPAFDLALCERVGIKPLEFDGENDSLFHPFDREGRRHMEYLRDRGTFADVPFETIQEAFSHAYPSLMTGTVLRGDFRSEAVAAVADEAAPA